MRVGGVGDLVYWGSVCGVRVCVGGVCGWVYVGVVCGV